MNTAMKILICSDGSPQAEQAVRMGATIAAGCQAEVTLFGISESPGESKGLLESLQRSQTILADKKVTAELVNKSGNAIEEIVRRTRETAYSLVVIGAVRKQTGGAFWLSSKSYKIVKEIQPPVLLVAGKGAAIKRILICSGGKRYIDHGVRLTGEIARSLGATVTLLHVMPGIPGILARLPRMEEDTAWLLKSESELGINLRHGLELLQATGISAQVRLRRGDVLEEILREIQEGEHDIVVTGSALSHTLRTYVLGDVSREIVNRAHRAVLVVRSQGATKEPRFPLLGWFSRGQK
jgi:nucleotide-binding universal stress UspA family protein